MSSENASETRVELAPENGSVHDESLEDTMIRPASSQEDVESLEDTSAERYRVQADIEFFAGPSRRNKDVGSVGKAVSLYDPQKHLCRNLFFTVLKSCVFSFRNLNFSDFQNGGFCVPMQTLARGSAK